MMTMLSTNYSATIAAGAELTFLQAAPAANLPIAIHQIQVSFQGTVNSTAPPDVSLGRQSDNGTGGQTVDNKNLPLDDRLSPTVSCAWQGGTWDTTEPTDIGNKRIFGSYIHPQTWMLFPQQFAYPIIVDGGNFLGININPSGVAAVTQATVWFTEGR